MILGQVTVVGGIGPMDEGGGLEYGSCAGGKDYCGGMVTEWLIISNASV